MLTIKADKKKYQVIDFIAFTESWMQESKNTSKKSYKSAVNALKRYINREELNIKDITNKFLTGFMEFLEERWRQKAEKLKKAGKIVPTNRATSLYLGSIRHLFNEAKKRYNDYDRNIRKSFEIWMIKGGCFSPSNKKRQVFGQLHKLIIFIIFSTSLHFLS